MSRSLDQRLASQGQKPTGPAGWVVSAVEGAVFIPINAHVARLAQLVPEDRVLDVACGSGAFLRRHAARSAFVAGIDHSEVQVATARRLLRTRLERGTAEVVHGDATRLPWPDEEFTVVCCNCLDCLGGNKPQAALAEMRRVLRPGGHLVIGVDRFVDHQKARRAERNGLNAFTRAELATALHGAGFTGVQISEHRARLYARTTPRFPEARTRVRS